MPSKLPWRTTRCSFVAPSTVNFRWSRVRKRFTLNSANAFFVGVMLDQGQKAERAWEGGRHLVAHHFGGRRGFWAEIRNTHPRTVAKICRYGHDGKSYASVYCVNRFPRWLRSAAVRMGDQYDGDPRAIWSVGPEKVALIYDRFREFDEIGDALAKMAQFALVRDHGVAGGRLNQSRMAVKPDILVRRVLARTGIAESDDIGAVLDTLESLNLRRPADFDAALWVIGREFCLKTSPRCQPCPLRSACLHSRRASGRL